MQIGFSLVDLAMGGAQVFFVQLAQGLAARRHMLSYWLAADSGDSQQVQPALKAALDEVARAVRHPWDLWQGDIVHLDGYHSLGRKLFFLPRWGRCVETYHSAFSVRRAGPFYPPYRVAVSEAVLESLPVPAQIIYQGIPLPSASFDEADRRFDVAILGRIHPVKNHQLFLAVCEELYRQRGCCSALVIGGHARPGAYQREIDAEIGRLRTLGINLQLTGDVPPEALWQWLSQARVLLVTSHSEGFGRMAVEAMACGVPVVVNPVGELMGTIQPGKTGFLAQRDDVDSFVEGTLRLLEDETLRRAMGQRGRAMAQERFSLERMVTEYETLYHEIAQQA